MSKKKTMKKQKRITKPKAKVLMANPFPKGFKVPVKAIPVRDAFPNASWAKSHYLKGYFAVVPAGMLPPIEDYLPAKVRENLKKSYLAYIDMIRRNNIRHIVEDAREEIFNALTRKLARIESVKGEIAKLESVASRSDEEERRLSGLKQTLAICEGSYARDSELYESLPKLKNNCTRLPRSMRVRFMVDTNMYRKGLNHENIFVSHVGRAPTWRDLDHEDIYKYGIDGAMRYAGEPWLSPVTEEDDEEA